MPTGRAGAGRDAGTAARALFGELQRLGMRRIHGSADPKMAVLSLPDGITVWVRAGGFTWRDVTGWAQWWSADDVVGAARRLLAEVQQRQHASAAGFWTREPQRLEGAGVPRLRA